VTPGDGGRAAVREEHAQTDDGRQNHGRSSQATELRGAEVADDRRVGEQHQRFRDEGDESRRSDRQDAPIEVVERPHAGPPFLWILGMVSDVDMSPAA
jgi:hypothetical protein